MQNHGIIIRRLRLLAELDLRAAASKIGKSTGWLSEVENSRGKARLTETEFQRILDLLDGARYCSGVGRYETVREFDFEVGDRYLETG